VATGVPLDVERARLILPIDIVEVEESGELSFTGVREVDFVCRPGEEVVVQ
jgi:hypothetical protein